MSQNCLCDINTWAPLVNLLLFYYSSSVLWAVELVSRHAQCRALGKKINVTLSPSPTQSFTAILPRVPCGKRANGARYNVLHYRVWRETWNYLTDPPPKRQSGRSMKKDNVLIIATVRFQNEPVLVCTKTYRRCRWSRVSSRISFLTTCCTTTGIEFAPMKKLA